MQFHLRAIRLILVIALAFEALSCGQEHFATPEKTLAFYYQNKAVGSNAALLATLTCFTQSDQEWFQKNYNAICVKLYGVDCPSGEVQAQTTIWTDKIEPAGPKKATADSVQIDDKAGTAVITIGKDEYDMVKVGADWKFDGMFGADAMLQEQLHLN